MLAFHYIDFASIFSFAASVILGCVSIFFQPSFWRHANYSVDHHVWFTATDIINSTARSCAVLTSLSSSVEDGIKQSDFVEQLQRFYKFSRVIVSLQASWWWISCSSSSGSVERDWRRLVHIHLTYWPSAVDTNDMLITLTWPPDSAKRKSIKWPRTAVVYE